MSAIVILASITLAAPDKGPDARLPIEAFVVTGKVAATILPQELRKPLESALVHPRDYDRISPANAELTPPGIEILVRKLADAFKTKTAETINAEANACVRAAVLGALPTDDDTINRLISAHHKRLAFEIRIDPRRLTAEPGIDTLSRAMPAAKSSLRARFVEGNLDHNLAVIETQLELAALLSAKLLTQAWHVAGDPTLAPAAPAARSEAQDDTQHIASKNSKVFHKQSCRHAGRIKQANVVRFDSVSEAMKTGRKPCKTCKPTG